MVETLRVGIKQTNSEKEAKVMEGNSIFTKEEYLEIKNYIENYVVK